MNDTMLSVIRECIVNEETGAHYKKNIAWFVAEDDAKAFKKLLEKNNQADDCVYYQLATDS